MSAQGIEFNRGSQRASSVWIGALVLVVAGLLGAASAFLLTLVPPVVPLERVSYPFNTTGHAILQTFFFVQHVGLAVGLYALWRSGAAGGSRLARIGGVGSVVVMAVFSVLELVVAGLGGATFPSPTTAFMDAGYGVVTLSLGVTLCLVGVGVLREHRWTGWHRWPPLATGVFVFVPMVPLLAIDFELARYAIGGWMLLFALVGWALSREEGDPR